jgi:ubiquinol-cytochrome c reductase cytochrome b subunit
MLTKDDWSRFLGLDAIDYKVPIHANTFWYSLGGLALIGFVITIVSGVLLTQFYNPSPAITHASVKYISNTPFLGWLRVLHHWGANLGFVLLIAHMLRVIFTGAYRPPRTITYLIGLGLFFVAFQNFFTGTVLKWDQEGYEAMAHFMAVNKLLGPLGAVFQEDFTLSTSMLARLYALHIGVFPLLLIVLVVLHALYVKIFGIAPKPYQEDEAYQASLSAGAMFSTHLKRLLIYGLLMVLILAGLSYFSQPVLLDPPKPGIEITKPPWLFWIFYPLESAIGISGILLGSIILFVGLILIPVLGFTISNEKTLFKTVNAVVIAGLIAWLTMLVITFFSPVMQHI